MCSGGVSGRKGTSDDAPELVGRELDGGGPMPPGVWPGVNKELAARMRASSLAFAGLKEAVC